MPKNHFFLVKKKHCDVCIVFLEATLLASSGCWTLVATSHVMRKIPLILGLTLLAVLTVRDTYEFFVTDDGVGYFTSQPHRLFYVTIIGVVGGVLALAFSRLSPVARRAVRLLALGGFATCVTGLLAIFAARLASFSSMVTASGMWGWVVATLGSLSVVAVLLWFEFYLVWRRHETVA